MGDVVGGPGDEAGGGKAVDLLHGKTLHLPEDPGPEPHGEGGRHLSGQKSRHHRQNQTAQSAQQHLATGQPDICHGAAFGLDQGGDLGHIVRHGEVQPDLPHDEQKAEQDHGHLFPLKSFKKLIHIASLPYL